MSVGLATAVGKKIAYTRPTGSKVEHARPGGDSGPYLKKLNSFVGLSIDPEKMSEMPYSEEAARFFCDMMLNLCRMAD